MSLVINANADWWWAYRVSNDMVEAPWYPDFNQLLLKPLLTWWWWKVPSSQTFPTTWDVVKTVNWTPINFWCEDIYAPICFQWDWAWNWIWWNGWFYAWNTSEYSVRFWLPYQMEAWKIIWKEIFWMLAWSTDSATTGTAKITVWLLHTDWTLTKLPEITITASIWYQVGVISEYAQSNENWLTTQAGDYVIVEFKYTMTTYDCVSFWRWWSPRAISFYGKGWALESRPLPVQISIE